MLELLRELRDTYAKAMYGHSIPTETSRDLLLRVDAILGEADSHRDIVQVTEWDRHALCACGWNIRAPFGEKFHIRCEVCPKCGSDKDSWHLVTARWARRRGWFKPAAFFQVRGR